MTYSATSGDRDHTAAGGRAGGSSGSSRPNEAPVPRAVRLLLFASARQAAGARQVDMSAATVGEVLDQARRRFGPAFAAVLDGSRVWLNGEPSEPSTSLVDGDEVAVLPPVSGG
jgi:molybdopterin converting factor small subunit